LPNPCQIEVANWNNSPAKVLLRTLRIRHVLGPPLLGRKECKMLLIKWLPQAICVKWGAWLSTCVNRTVETRMQKQKPRCATITTVNYATSNSQATPTTVGLRFGLVRQLGHKRNKPKQQRQQQLQKQRQRQRQLN